MVTPVVDSLCVRKTMPWQSNFEFIDEYRNVDLRYIQDSGHKFDQKPLMHENDLVVSGQIYGPIFVVACKTHLYPGQANATDRASAWHQRPRRPMYSVVRTRPMPRRGLVRGIGLARCHGYGLRVTNQANATDRASALHQRPRRPM